jgi:MFS family permease
MSDTATDGHVEPQAPLPTETPTLEADASSPPRRVLRGLRTLESFGYRDYRYFFFGALLSNIGTWTQTVALGWVIYALTRSSSALGIVNFLSGIPIVFLALVAGTLVDHTDRRVLLIRAQVLLMLQAVAFAYLNHTGHITIGWIYALTLVGGIIAALIMPAWQAVIPNLVPRSSLLNAVALSSAQFNAARFLGPAVTAAIMAVFAANEDLGITMVFVINALSFLFVIYALSVIRPTQVVFDRAEGRSRDALTAGLSYVRQNRHVAMHLLTATVLVIFGMPFMTLLPAIAVDALGLSGTGYSGLMGSNGFGALVGALAVASLPRSVRRESIIRDSLFVMALAAIALSFSRSYALSSVILVIMGASFLACVSSINTNVQVAVPDHLRGRVMALYVVAFMGMMPFGALGFGALGDLIGPMNAVLAGAIVLLGWAVYNALHPRLLCAPDCP